MHAHVLLMISRACIAGEPLVILRQKWPEWLAYVPTMKLIRGPLGLAKIDPEALQVKEVSQMGFECTLPHACPSVTYDLPSMHPASIRPTTTRRTNSSRSSTGEVATRARSTTPRGSESSCGRRRSRWCPSPIRSMA